MTIHSSNEVASSLDRRSADQRRVRPFSIWRLASKELRETLRDRRTIITLVLMPLLVYPILSLIFRTFLLSNAESFAHQGPVRYRIACIGDGTTQDLTKFLDRVVRDVVAHETAEKFSADSTSVGSLAPLASSDAAAVQPILFGQHDWRLSAELPESQLEELIEAGDLDAGIVVDSTARHSGQLGSVRTISRPDYHSRRAAEYLQDRLTLFNRLAREKRMRTAGLTLEPALVVDAEVLAGEESSPASVAAESFSLASLIPLILVLMTITGAVYPAIDLTAGERERGTLEMLMAAPVPRTSILISKFIAVLTVAVLTAVLNLIGMSATIWAFQLDQFLTGDAAFNFGTLLKVLALLILFAAFFSALLLAVTSYARSFKEAQAYLVPIILLSMGPGLMAMTPGLELAGPLMFTPMMNILLLGRDVIQQNVSPTPALIAIFSTATYAGIAILVAAKTFGSASMLYAQQGSVAELFQRPGDAGKPLPLVAALGCMALLFPVNFVMIGVLGRLATETPADLAARFTIMGAFTILAFAAIPWLIASHQRAKPTEVFGLARPKLRFIMLAIVLGLSLWPMVASLIEWYGMFVNGAADGAWQQRLVSETTEWIGRIRKVHPVTIAVFLSIVPALCEEFFFRGMLLRSLLQWRSAFLAIFLSAFVFGLFHVLSNSVISLDRLLPTTLIGLVLGFLAWKSNSIWPGVLLHAIHNATVVFLGYYEPRLREQAWFPDEATALPWQWLGISAVCVTISLVILSRVKTVLDE